jgi:uridine phosphorylase
VLTTDTFYSGNEDWWKIWARHGVLAAEVETAALYTLAARFSARALSILTVSDQVVSGEHASAEDQQTGFGEMAEDVGPGRHRARGLHPRRRSSRWARPRRRREYRPRSPR